MSVKSAPASRPTSCSTSLAALGVSWCTGLQVVQPSRALVVAVAAHVRRRLRECTPPRTGGCLNVEWLRAAQYVKLLMMLGPTLFKWQLLAETRCALEQVAAMDAFPHTTNLEQAAALARLDDERYAACC